jgi:hypothetical protein
VSLAQKWIAGLLGLGALFLVATQGSGLFQAAKAGRELIGGTESDIISGGKK